MAEKPDVILGEEHVDIRGAEDASPVLDIEGEDNWNLSESVGDVRIGDDDNMLKMGVALGGGGAGNCRIRATSDLRFGSREETVVRIDGNGIHPHNGSYSLGTDGDRWGSLKLDGDLDVLGGDVTLDPTSSFKAEGNVLLLGRLALDAEIFGPLMPGGGYDIGDSDQRWNTLYVDSVDKSSDRRLKTDIEDVTDGLETVLGLRPVSYSLKRNGDETHLGLIGQEVAEVLPEVVSTPDDGDGHLGLDYMEVVPVLIDALQEEHADREALEERVEQQEARIEALEDRLAALEAES